MSLEEKHLTVAQIERLIGAFSISSDEGDSRFLEQARQHLSTCDFCERALSMERDGDRILRKMAGDNPAESTEDCPSSTVLFELVGGLVDEAVSQRIMKHVTECEHCGPRLRNAIANLRPELTTEELALIASLETSRPESQARLAHKLASVAESVTGGRPASDSRYRWLAPSRIWPLAAAGILAAVIILVGFLRQSGAGYTNELLARAYSEERTFDLRIPDASYAPLRVERGISGSRLNRPTSLLDAESRIGKESLKHPNDGFWLAAKGRAELLERNYDDAIQNLDTALMLLPSSDSVRIDLATAHAERARAEKQPWDDGEAVELLKAVLKKDPRNIVANFNLSLILERQSLFNEAADSWRRYLQLDSNSGWAEEARKRLSDDEAKIKGISNLDPLQEPAQLVHRFGKDPDGADDLLEARVEEYLRDATVKWLPYAFGNGSLGTRHEVIDVLKHLASVLKSRHRDNWLVDLLDRPRTSALWPALADLSSAMVANERGDYATGELHSRRAAKKFEIAKNRPGYLRARFEQAYSARLSHEANECYVDITSVLNGLSEKKYSWLSIQSTLEAQECLNMLGKVGRAASLSAVTIREAAESRYPVLAARALLFAADIDEAVGDISSAWKRTHEGLAWSWNARLPRMRVYSFETELETLANDAGQGHFDECVIRDSLKLLDGEDNPLMRAVEHHRLAEVALLIDDSETAEHEFVAAEELFASSPSNRITDANRTEAEIWLARVQVQRRQYAKARELLERNRESLKATSNRYLLTEYFQSMGRAQMGLGDVRGAEDSLLRALYGTESTLKSLRSETERLNWERESSSVYKDIVELKLKMGDTLGALEVWEWYRGSAVRNSLNQETGRAGTPENFNLSQAAQKASTAELMEVSRLRPSLDSSTVMSFAFLSDGLVVWIYDDRGVVFKRISDPYGEIPDLVRRFADLCADRNSDLPTLRLFAHRLFDIILQPVLSSLHLERLLVVEPDGPLWALPFAALIDRQEKYLIDSLVLTQLPGIYYRHRLANAHGIGREEKAMIVVSRESASANGQPLPLLPNAESEAHLVAGKFTKSVLLNGDNSSVISIRGQLPGLNLFHFVGHAVSTVDGTSLLLSSTHDDLTVLTSSDITGLHLTSVRLVFLSGCKTAKGAGGSGLVDSRNLASAFLRAGAGYVLASRWNIDSIGTESFVDTFYSSLLGGDSAPQALRKAAQRVRASTVHPYYWAAFDAFGSTV